MAPVLLALVAGGSVAWLAVQQRIGVLRGDDTVQVLRSADAVLLPEGALEHRGLQALPLRWDQLHPGRDGRAAFQLALPATAADQPQALLFTRLGNQAEVRINDELVLNLGVLGQADHDAAKAPHFLAVPPRLLRRDGSDMLRVDIGVQALRGGVLSEVHVGPQAAVGALYRRQALWRQTAPLAYCVTFAVVGLLSLALWARLREPLFACFSLASWLGIVRNLDRVWPEPALPWPIWGALVNTAYAWHLALMLLFVVLVLQWRGQALRLALLGYLPLSLALVLASFALGQAWPWSVALYLLMPLGVAVFAGVVRHAMAERPGRLTARVLAGAGALAVPAGIYDLLFVRGEAGAGSGFSLTPLAMFLFVLVMGGVIVDRYVRNVAELRRMNQTLDARVRARERELEASHAQLRAQQAAQAAAGERQRIMRDLHDGVGAQLVGLQSLLRGQAVPAALLRAGVDAALDEMRLAVDSMQLADGDLTTALATLRYRVRPRLEAAGLALHWQVEELPAVEGLSPHTVMQIQRILLEALTNVLKHARASAIWVQCQWLEAERCLLLEVADDGVGFDASAQGAAGQGLKNMQARAESIGGRLQWLAREGGGSRVVLEWTPG